MGIRLVTTFFGVLFSFLVVNPLVFGGESESANATESNATASLSEVSGEYYDWTRTMQPERPWIHNYNQTLVMKFFMCHRNERGEVRQVYLKFADVLDVLKRMDAITLGIPKVVYLVGWQYQGHDSRYPAWDEVNEALKRPEDATALDSLKWLMREAKTYHTTISLHINMIDAFEDSPLWQEYFDQDIIAKDKEGNPIKGEVFDGMQSYQISHAQEWKLGYTQRRIDRLLAMLPELKEAGTIHVDAFHSMRPSGPNEPISPYLVFSTEDEMTAQRKIFRYWRNQGIDMTCEGGMYWLRKDPFLGLQAMTWHYDETTFARDDWMGKPVDFSTLPATLCTYSAMQSELNVMSDREKLPGLIEQVCTHLVPWYYKRNADVAKVSDVIITEDEVFCPVLWQPRTVVAFSRSGFSECTLRLPSTWVGVKEVQLSLLTLDGLQKLRTIPVENGRIVLATDPNQPVVITVL